jgi:hypothetical protein
MLVSQETRRVYTLANSKARPVLQARKHCKDRVGMIEAGEGEFAPSFGTQPAVRGYTVVMTSTMGPPRTRKFAPSL